MILDGFVLGLMSWAGMAFTYRELPDQLKPWLVKHSIFTDMAATAFVFMTVTAISKSTVAVISTMVTGLLVNLSLMWLKWRYYK